MVVGSVADIQGNGRDERAMVAASLMKAIHSYLFDDRDPLLATIFAERCFRGNDRIIKAKDVPFFIFLVESFGIDEAVMIGLHQFRVFHHFDRPIIPPRHMALNINRLSDSDCRHILRFDSTAICTIVQRLPFATVQQTFNRDKYTLLEGFCIILLRMHYPCRWFDLTAFCCRCESSISYIFWSLVSMILQRVKRQLVFAHEDPVRWAAYKDAFKYKGAPDDLSIAGSLDAKQVAICRPRHNQRSQYTRHKQMHCFKFQTVVVPDGLIIHTTEANSGRNHDARIVRDSGLMLRWRASPVLSRYRLIADSAYPNNTTIVSLFTKPQMANDQDYRNFNRTMSPLREPVEWGYQRVVKLWSLLDMKPQMRIGDVSVSDLWLIGVWLTNLVTCAEGGNQISTFYGSIKPPTLKEYLDMTLGEE